jgi:hypothetical protein
MMRNSILSTIKVLVVADTAARDCLGKTMELLVEEEHGKLIMEFHFQEVEVTILEIYGQYALTATEKNPI